MSWDTVENKLINSITAIEYGTKLETETMESGQTANKSSSLSAIAEGPRFRLMLASFHWLKNEAGTFSYIGLYFSFYFLNNKFNYLIIGGQYV